MKIFCSVVLSKGVREKAFLNNMFLFYFRIDFASIKNVCNVRRFTVLRYFV